ncbi:MAG TPA: uracil-DNA glycosylase [Bryobacteraceae bacterium]|nr:uracil-DNA glycosylase [Bryobacteraceae bacterium]
MAEILDREQLVRRLTFYRDLGIKTLWTGGVNVESGAQPDPVPAQAVNNVQPPSTPPPSVEFPPPAEVVSLLPPIFPTDDKLELIRHDMGDCTRCRLGRTRKNIVFGSGNPEARLVLVGEGPGADEDEQGLPFVGRAGQLLTQMIDNTASKEGIPIRRENVYICNVVKCRPPENRAPEPDEMETCGQFLFRQLMVIKPQAIVALGGTAAKALLDLKTGITKARGNWYKWRDIPVMPTYHPSYLLRPYNQNAKREAWEDLKKVLHYVYD